MGSGKSHLAPLLAERLNFTPFDLDDVIVEAERQSVSKLISESEMYFRKLELAYCKQILNSNSNLVLALGGGAFCQAELRELILSNSKNIVIYLSLSNEEFDNRMEVIKINRPLLQAFGAQYKEKAKALYQSRKGAYQNAHLHLDSHSSLDDILKQIEEHGALR